MRLRRDDSADDQSVTQSAAASSSRAQNDADDFDGIGRDDIERGGDVDVTRQCLERSRLRRTRQGRQFLAVAALCLMIFVLIARWWSPPAPQMSIAWPSQALGSSNLASGATVSMRGGQPFTVTIENAAQWKTTWKWNLAQGEGVPMRWSPVGNVDTLTLNCRARPQGAQWLWSWLWPTRVLDINATAPVALGRKRFVIVPLQGAPVRISSRVVATQNASGATEARWHEDALPLLEAAARNKTLKSGAIWTIVPSSDGKTPARDDSTYAALSEFAFQNPVEALTQCALQIEELSPKTDIKWVARLKPASSTSAGSTPRAILWLDFEKRRKTGARGGWIVESGNVAQPTKWWKESD